MNRRYSCNVKLGNKAFRELTAKRHADEVSPLPAEVLQQRERVGREAIGAVFPEAREYRAAADAPATAQYV